jgi:hypothetical protein
MVLSSMQTKFTVENSYQLTPVSSWNRFTRFTV